MTTAVMTITIGMKERTIINSGISRFINELVRIKNGALRLEAQRDLLNEFVSVAESYPSLDNGELAGALSFLMMGH